jgi:hypothetical protein
LDSEFKVVCFIINIYLFDPRNRDREPSLVQQVAVAESMIHAPIGAQKENDQTGISRNYHAFEERGRKFSAINVLLSKL